MRCEGWRRYGGVFTFGPVEWRQCENEGIVILEVEQEGKIEKLPACDTCWREVIEKGIKILSVHPLPTPSTKEGSNAKNQTNL